MSIIPVILAGGQGTRMKSALPKVLHPVMGKPMIAYVLDEVAEITEVQPVVVIGHGGEAVRAAVQNRAAIAVQRQQLGTANAVQAAEAAAAGKADYTLVAYSDMPCLCAETMRRVCEAQRANPDGAFAMLTIVQEDSHGFGRILRKEDGSVAAIVEEAQATPEQLAIQECNVGLYCFRSDWLWSSLSRVKLSPKGEYYLTDLVELANADQLPVVAVVLTDQEEALGVNNRVHLSEAERYLRQRVNHRWMMAGVTMIDPETTYIGASVRLEPDVTLLPGCWIEGETTIGSGTILGPSAKIMDSVIGKRCRVGQASLDHAVVADDQQITDFQVIRNSRQIG